MDRYITLIKIIDKVTQHDPHTILVFTDTCIYRLYNDCALLDRLYHYVHSVTGHYILSYSEHDVVSHVELLAVLKKRIND